MPIDPVCGMDDRETLMLVGVYLLSAEHPAEGSYTG